MIRLLLTCLLSCSLLSEISSGQIDISYTKAKSLVGATNPRVIGERILIGEDSKPQVVTVAVIKVQSTERVRLKARKSLFEFAELVQLSDTEFLLAGEGEYLVEAISFSWDASLKVSLGPEPEPKPPEPDKPDVPGDEFNNVGQRVASWAIGLPKRNEVAALYRLHAKKLQEDPAATINTVTAEMLAARNTLLGADAAKYQPMIDKLNADLKTRWPLAKGTLADYFLAIAIGLEGSK